jgi:hypothetical protein
MGFDFSLELEHFVVPNDGSEAVWPAELPSLVTEQRC